VKKREHCRSCFFLESVIFGNSHLQDIALISRFSCILVEQYTIPYETQRTKRTSGQHPSLTPTYPPTQQPTNTIIQRTILPASLQTATQNVTNTAMPTISVPFALSTQHSDLINLHRSIMHLHLENLASGLVLIALLTYFYTAFSKIFQPGGEEQQQNGKQALMKLESRIYYSSPAAV
jgi:hypothetical protein